MFKAKGKKKSDLEIEDKIEEIIKLSDQNFDEKISEKEFLNAFQKNSKILMFE